MDSFPHLQGAQPRAGLLAEEALSCPEAPQFEMLSCSPKLVFSAVDPGSNVYRLQIQHEKTGVSHIDYQQL